MPRMIHTLKRKPPSPSTLAKMQPDKASRTWLEWLGYRVENVERWSGRGTTRRDLFGFLDLLGIHTETGELLGIQATSRDNVSSRVRKIRESEWFELVVHRSPIEVRVWGWKDGDFREVRIE